jgi:hypothetical protein
MLKVPASDIHIDGAGVGAAKASGPSLEFLRACGVDAAVWKEVAAAADGPVKALIGTPIADKGAHDAAMGALAGALRGPDKKGLVRRMRCILERMNFAGVQFSPGAQRDLDKPLPPAASALVAEPGAAQRGGSGGSSSGPSTSAAAAAAAPPPATFRDLIDSLAGWGNRSSEQGQAGARKVVFNRLLQLAHYHRADVVDVGSGVIEKEDDAYTNGVAAAGATACVGVWAKVVRAPTTRQSQLLLPPPPAGKDITGTRGAPEADEGDTGAGTSGTMAPNLVQEARAATQARHGGTLSAKRIQWSKHASTRWCIKAAASRFILAPHPLPPYLPSAQAPTCSPRSWQPRPIRKRGRGRRS